MAIHPTAVVDPSARLADDVEVGAYAYIGPGVEIASGAWIAHHASLFMNTKVGEGTKIWPMASVGGDPQDLKYGGEETWLEIGPECVLREFATVNRGTGEGGGVTRIGKGCLLMSYSHVAHDCQIGNQVIMANSATLGGHVVVEDNVGLGGLTAIHQFTRIGTHCFVGGMSGVAQDLPPFTLCEGNRAKPHGLNLIGLRRAGFSSEVIEALKLAYRIIFRTHTPIKQAVQEARDKATDLPEVRHLLDFIAGSQRGVAR